VIVLAVAAGLLIGSILTVPALVYLLGQSAHQATTVSLMVVGTAAAVGALVHARGGRVRLKAGATFGVLGIAGSYAGSRAAQRSRRAFCWPGSACSCSRWRS